MTGLRGAERESYPLTSSTDVVLVRHRVRERAATLGLGLVAQTKLITAVSELSRNCVIHGKGGTATVDFVHAEHPTRTGIRLVIDDEGPGIPDIDLAMTEGWTSGDGLGLGLPGSRRLADEFEIRSEGGVGTSVTIVFWAPP